MWARAGMGRARRGPYGEDALRGAAAADRTLGTYGCGPEKAWPGERLLLRRIRIPKSAIRNG